MQARHQAEVRVICFSKVAIFVDIQISRYQDERKELISRQEQDIPATIKQTRQLQRENAEVS